jgi:AcrR family transcriptional regulator
MTSITDVKGPVVAASAHLLEPKKQPAQKRAVETYERILQVTAEVLAEVGVERLSTNLVCKQAGLTPPALYRYFPNKYALLHELGARLMRAQNELVERWLTPEVLLDPVDTLHPAMVGLFLDTYRVTTETTAGLWITRALRAVPLLNEVRIASHQVVTEQMQAAMAFIHPEVDLVRLRINIRLSVEVLYSAMEMLFDDPSLDVTVVADSSAWQVYDLFDRMGVVKRPG